MRWKVLVSAPYILPVLDLYRTEFEQNDIEIVEIPVNERLSEEELFTVVDDLDGVICGDDAFTKRVLESAPRLKVISKWGTGIDSIDSETAERLGIIVSNTPGAFTDPVADTVMGYILMFARGLPWLDKEMRAGRWVKHSGMSLRECTLGVVGMGDVGQAVVKRASAFGMTLLGTDIVDVDRPFLDGQGLQMVNLDDLIVESDYISLNCTLNPTSFHLIGLDELLRMKDTCYVINTCRGPVIQESALVTALQKGIIAGAALDVFEHEPLAEDSPLRKLENCFLAPHNANSSPKAWRLVHENTIKNLLLGLEKGNRD